MADAPVTQLIFGEDRLTIYGRLLALNAGGMQVSLESLPPDEKLFAPGSTSRLTLNMPHGDYELPVSVVSFERPTNTLLLSFTEAIKPVQRRQATRFPISHPILARPVYADGRITPWQHVNTLNLSIGGMRICLTKCVASPIGAEVRFRFPSDRNESLISCRVAHAKALGMGRFEVGLNFTKLSAATSVQLVKFIEQVADKLDSAVVNR
jgi:hypothetical protein